MDRYEWRGRAKVVAIADMVITSMLLLLVIVMAVMAGFATGVVSNLDRDSIDLDNLPVDPDTGKRMVIPDKATMEALVVGIWIMVAISALFTIIELWAAIKLLNGTEMGRDPADAHRLCKIFWNVCIVITVLDVIGRIFSGSYITLVIGLLLRLTYLFVVYNFMQELEVAQASPNSFGVTVKV